MLMQANLILIVNDINSLYALLAQGYRILLCTEDELPSTITVHPNVIKTSILLPPYEAVSFEVDRQLDTAVNKYFMYLSTYSAASSVCNIAYISALRGTPLALYLGSESNDLQLVQQLPRYLQYFKGMWFNQYGPGSIDLSVAPAILQEEYLNGNFNGMQILSFYPQNMDLPDMILVKLLNELKPPVDKNDLAAANQYFKQLVVAMNGQCTNQYGQQYYCPFVGGSYAADGGGKE